MRRGFLLSLLVHLVLLLLFVLNISAYLMPEPQVVSMQVKLVADPNAARRAKPHKVKAVHTQQSSAPKAAPKPTPRKPKVADANKPHLVTAADADKKIIQQKKPEPKTQAEQQKDNDIRPPKLDKTPNKKNILAAKEPQTKPEKPDPEDFMAALDYIDDLKDKKSALKVDDTATQTTLYDTTQQEIGTIKALIERNWYLPPGMADKQGVDVTILVRMNPDGTIADMTIEKSSGRQFVDDSLLRAIRKSVPLPIPADKYDTFKSIEFHFNGDKGSIG